jgi:uncharacterized protein (DUF433 family)
MAETAVSPSSFPASPEYVAQTPEGAWRVVDTRVSLDSVVHAYLDGLDADAIADLFPTLSAEQIHGALAFYLRHRTEIDRYLADQQERWDALQAASEKQNGPLLDRLRDRSTGRARQRAR